MPEVDVEKALELALEIIRRDKHKPQAVAPTEPPRPQSVSLFIGTPSNDGIMGPYFSSCLGLVNECTKRKVNHSFFLLEGSSLLPAARNSIIREFLKTKHTHALLVDNDIGFDPKNVFRMLETGHDFVAGAVPMRKVNIDAMKAALAAGKTDIERHLSQFNVSARDTNFHVDLDEDGCCEISFAGTAFLLVSRRAIETMIAAYPELKYTEDGGTTYDLFGCIVRNGEYHGEDVSFCLRWRECGGKIYCMPDMTFTHQGPCQFRGRFQDALEM